MRRKCLWIVSALVVLFAALVGVLLAGAIRNKRELDELKHRMHDIGIDGLRKDL